jgi:hypothetical protein
MLSRRCRSGYACAYTLPRISLRLHTLIDDVNLLKGIISQALNLPATAVILFLGV